ncbi:MAG: SRPBCC family protein [Planctomycetes bacterium]|nr:SRPBCC family protein [Planctomycetota bacterium]
MESELSIVVERPVAEVFAKTLNDVTAWSRTCLEEEVLEDRGGVGTRLRLVTEERGQRMEFLGTVTEHAAPRYSALHLVGPHFDLDVRYDFEDLGGRTRVTQRSRVSGKGSFKLMIAVGGPVMKQAAQAAQRAELERLKAYCEG